MHKGIYPLAMIIALAIAAQAQTSRGTVSGTVMDASGALVPGASVIVVGTETGVRRTNEAGIYSMSPVNNARFDISRLFCKEKC
jgi:hypothetical protein